MVSVVEKREYYGCPSRFGPRQTSPADIKRCLSSHFGDSFWYEKVKAIPFNSGKNGKGGL